MAEHQLPYFNFPVYEEEDDADLIEENKALRDLIPFLEDLKLVNNVTLVLDNAAE